MKASLLLSLALAGAAAGCATPPPSPPREQVAEASRAREANSPARDLLSSAPSPATELEDAVRAVFASPRFGERLAESYLAVTEVEPRVTSVEHEQLLEIIDAVMAEQYDKAHELLDKHGQGADANAVFDFTRANVYVQQDRPREAAAAYAAAVEKHPRFQRAWQGLGQVHARAGDFALAVPAFVRVLELGGGDAITYGLLGIAHLSVGSYVAAESAFRMASLLDPATIEWRLYLADSLFKQERLRDAIALIEGLLAEEPDRAELWLLQAGAYIRVGEPLRAAENYELVDGLGGSTAESLSNLGDIYVNAELFDLGVDAHLRALAMDPRAALARAITASKALTARGALEAVKLLVAGIEARAGDEVELGTRKDLLKLRSRIAVAEGAGDEEARALEEIVELDPLDGEALILLGRHAARGGDRERAEFLYERATNVEGFEAEATMRHGELLVGQARYQEGLVLLRRSQELKPRGYLQDFIEKVERIAQNR